MNLILPSAMLCLFLLASLSLFYVFSPLVVLLLFEMYLLLSALPPLSSVFLFSVFYLQLCFSSSSRNEEWCKWCCVWEVFSQVSASLC